MCNIGLQKESVLDRTGRNICTAASVSVASVIMPSVFDVTDSIRHFFFYFSSLNICMECLVVVSQSFKALLIDFFFKHLRVGGQ